MKSVFRQREDPFQDRWKSCCDVAEGQRGQTCRLGWQRRQVGKHLAGQLSDQCQAPSHRQSFSAEQAQHRPLVSTRPRASGSKDESQSSLSDDCFHLMMVPIHSQRLRSKMWQRMRRRMYQTVDVADS